MKETIDLLGRARKWDGSWRQKAENWVQVMEEATKAAAHANFDMIMQHARPRLKAPRKLLIEVFTNKPARDRITDEWKLMRIEVSPRYTMQDIYHKARSRWKERWKIEWAELGTRKFDYG
jgi:hypothetical protein